MLYLKVAELLSSGLQMAIEQIKAGKLCLSSTVKQGKELLGTRCEGLVWSGSIKGVAKAMGGLSECEPPLVCPGLTSYCPLAQPGLFNNVEGNVPLCMLTWCLKALARVSVRIFSTD